MKKKIVIESSIDKIDDVYQWLQSLLKDKVAQKLSQTILLITQEMTTNSILHGNRLSSTKSVIIEVEITSTQVIVEIEDEGVGITELPTKEESKELDYLAENGRGLKLAVLMSDEIELNGNRVTLIFNRL
ncbi:MAG: ATP-binding protein [Epsilonproteobacteria bacterium]|nr:ATP-binding protein [Campylobacterota bacterium]